MADSTSTKSEDIAILEETQGELETAVDLLKAYVKKNCQVVELSQGGAILLKSCFCPLNAKALRFLAKYDVVTILKDDSEISVTACWKDYEDHNYLRERRS